MAVIISGEIGSNLTPIGRFMDKVYPEPMSGCWVWLGNVDVHGYGCFWFNGKNVKAHRWMYEQVKASPGSLDIDHICSLPLCVNPDHLQAVTRGKNTQLTYQRGRSFLIGNIHKRKTHCPANHEYSMLNTYHYRGERHCKTCKRERTRQWRLQS